MRVEWSWRDRLHSGLISRPAVILSILIDIVDAESQSNVGNGSDERSSSEPGDDRLKKHGSAIGHD